MRKYNKERMEEEKEKEVGRIRGGQEDQRIRRQRGKYRGEEERVDVRTDGGGTKR